MVACGISKSELVSRVREFLRGLSREEIKQLSREEFARSMGVDLLNTSSEYKRELAKLNTKLTNTSAKLINHSSKL